MNYKDNIEWLKSLKQQIGQTQHCDLWHFEQVIDETIENLKPLAKPHGDLIDKEPIKKFILDGINKTPPESFGYDGIEILAEIEFAPAIIEAEVSE